MDNIDFVEKELNRALELLDEGRINRVMVRYHIVNAFDKIKTNPSRKLKRKSITIDT